MSKPWVFIIGGTGEEPDKDHRFHQLLEGEINIYEKEVARAEAQLAASLDINSPFYIRENKIKEREKIKDKRDRRVAILNEKIKKYNEHYEEFIKPYAYSSYDLFSPPPGQAAKVVMVKGVGIPRLNIKKSKLFDFLTANSEKKALENCMAQLKSANPLPDNIVLNGTSRGASSCIELARAIYLAYGDTPKISINIIDPVPGFGRHTKSKAVIPPNVNSLVITYAGNEAMPYLKPQDLKEIFYDQAKTTVTTLSLPMTHIEMFNDEGLGKKVKSINTALLDAVTNNNKTEITLTNEVNKKSKSFTRGNSEFVIATHTMNNSTITPSLGGFHNSLREAAKMEVSMPNVKSLAASSNQPLTEKDRKKRLAEIYLQGKNNLKNKNSIDLFANIALNQYDELRVDNPTNNCKAMLSSAGIDAKEVKLIHKGNNVNFQVALHDGISLKIVIGGDYNNQSVIKSLANAPYLSPIFYKKSNSKEQFLVTEYCGSSLLQLAENNKKQTNDIKMNSAINIGKQVANMLIDLDKNNVIWKDLKAENILLRDNQTIAISDTKSFVSKSDPTASLADGMTRAYVPNNMVNQDNELDKTKNNNENWKKIYSYQLAVILYHQATGDLIKNEYDHFGKIEKDNAHHLEKCTHPVFDTPEGSRLKFVIEKLATNNMSYMEASKLLEVMDNQKRYDQVLNSIQSKNIKVKQPQQAAYRSRNMKAKDKAPSVSTGQHDIKANNHMYVADKNPIGRFEDLVNMLISDCQKLLKHNQNDSRLMMHEKHLNMILDWIKSHRNAEADAKSHPTVEISSINKLFNIVQIISKEILSYKNKMNELNAASEMKPEIKKPHN